MSFPVPTGPPFDIGNAGGVHAIPPSLQPAGPSAGNIEAWRTQLNELVMSKVTLALTGMYVPNPTKPTAFEQLQTWASTHDVGNLFEILTGIPDANDNDLGSWVNSLLRFRRPVPQVQAASVVDTNPNLILAPNFPTTGTVVQEQGWTWDSGNGHDAIGSIKVVAAGFISELVSNEIAVVADQKLELSVWVKWTGVSFTGTNPIVLGITRYAQQLRPDGLMQMTEVGSDDLAFVASPATASDWVQLSVSAYPVPAGCDEIRLRFKIGANLTAGTVYWDDASVTKTQPGSGYIGNLVDKTINGLENLDANNWGLDDLLATMLTKFRTTADHGARITLLENLQSAGNKINDEFLRVGGSLGANWNQTYIGAGAGTWGTDGDYAVWSPSGVGTVDVRARYIGTPSTTTTDNQTILAILGSKGEVGYLPSIVGLIFICESHVDLYGRMDTGETNWVRARFSARGAVTITRSLAGVLTDIGSAAGYDILLSPGGVRPAGAGSTIALVCGTGAGARFFEAQINGVVVCAASDSTSALGASFRGYGHGVRCEGNILNLTTVGQADPAKMNAWAAKDT